MSWAVHQCLVQSIPSCVSVEPLGCVRSLQIWSCCITILSLRVVGVRERFWQPMAANGRRSRSTRLTLCRSPPTQAPSRAASFLSLLFFFLYAKVHTVHACFHGFMLSQPARIRASPVCDRFHVHALPGRLRVPGQLFHWVPTTKAPLALATYRRLAYTYHKNVLLPSRDKSSQDKTRQGKKKNGRPPPLPCTADIIPSHSSVPRANPAMKANPARAPPHAARGTQYHS